MARKIRNLTEYDMESIVAEFDGIVTAMLRASELNDPTKFDGYMDDIRETINAYDPNLEVGRWRCLE